MSQIDSSLLNSLGASLMTPQAPEPQGGITNPYMHMLRRRQGQQQSARPGPRGQGTPMAQHIGTHNPGLWSQAGPYAVTTGTGGGPGNEGASAVNLDNGSEGGGPSGPAILTPDAVQPHTLPAPDKGAPTWKDQMKLDEGRLGALNHQYDHLNTQVDREFDPAKKAALQAQLNGIHSQRTALEQGLYAPNSLEERELGDPARRKIVNGVPVGDNDVNLIASTAHPYQQIQPGEAGPTGKPYQPAEAEVNQASAHVRQPVQVQPGEPGQSGRPYQPASVATQKQSDLHAHLATQGVPQAPTPGALLDANQAAAIKQAAGGNPDVAAKIALQMGYNIKQMKPAAQAPAQSNALPMSGVDMQ